MANAHSACGPRTVGLLKFSAHKKSLRIPFCFGRLAKRFFLKPETFFQKPAATVPDVKVRKSFVISRNMSLSNSLSQGGGAYVWYVPAQKSRKRKGEKIHKKMCRTHRVRRRNPATPEVCQMQSALGSLSRAEYINLCTGRIALGRLLGSHARRIYKSPPRKDFSRAKKFRTLRRAQKAARGRPDFCFRICPRDWPCATFASPTSPPIRT